jgi:thiol-disulfide isomerase/thioredoxin
MRKLIPGIIFLDILLASVFHTAFAAASEVPRGILKLDGRDAPPLKLKNLDGDEWDIASARGHWVFVHFWASWCGPCRKEMPTIQAIIPRFKNTNLKIVLINTAESYDTAFGFIGSIAPELDTLLDSDGQTTERWQPRGLPSTYFVDPDGKLRYLALGGREWNNPVYLDFLHNLIKQQ